MGTFGAYTGTMNIPQEKRDVFVKQVEKILNYGGMMQFEKVNLCGDSLGLLIPIELIGDKKLNFHYNYFEDDAWETADFDPKGMYFYSEKIGSSEFADVIIAIYFLYEMYDEGSGFTEVNGEIVNNEGYVGWLNHLLGTEFSMKKRFRLWENAQKFAFARVDYRETFNMGHLSSIIPDGMVQYAGGTEHADLLYIINGTESLTKEHVKEGSYPEDVFQCKDALKQYFAKNTEESDLEKVLELLKMDRVSRKNISEGELLEIAQKSLFLPARVISYLTAEIKGISFWEMWKNIYENVYHDEIMKKYASDDLQEARIIKREQSVAPMKTSTFLRQDGYFVFWHTPEELKGKENYYISDDDRLYWWDGSEEVIISERTCQWLEELAVEHKRLMETVLEKEDDEFLRGFMKLLVEIERFYKRIFPFRSMFYEFLQNGKKKEYQAAVELLRKLSDENKEEGSIIEKAGHDWELSSKNVTHNIGRLRIKRYLSVMANKRLRKKYFGF